MKYATICALPPAHSWICFLKCLSRGDCDKSSICAFVFNALEPFSFYVHLYSWHWDRNLSVKIVHMYVKLGKTRRF